MSGDPTLAALQRAPGSASPPVPPSLPLRVDNVRTFTTPDFAGITFLEVQTKSALNKVTGMPFPWSINPYRGCSHACSYCLEGETPILMADGRTRPIADLRPGDEIYGTQERDGRRHYVTTRVLDHWSTVKPAHRLVLEDGTRLIASADHRFLSAQGWRHVTESAGADLLGTGQFAAPPKQDEAYRRGYLHGLLHSEATSPIDGQGLRVELVDWEVLDRAQAYLAEEGIPTARGTFALELHDPAPVPVPDDPPEAWHKGLLAALFDAEGSFRGGVLRVARTRGIHDRATAALARLGLTLAIQGLAGQLRFLHLTDPAVTRKRSIAGQALDPRATLRVVAVERLGVDLPLYDITTGTGDFIADGVVSHNCFARPTHAYLNLSPLGDFERTIVVKTNVAEVLRRELARPSWRGEHVAMGTNTDPYQRAEGRYRLMPGIVSALADGLTPFSILTKGTLITRDIPALQAAAARVPVSAAMTVGMLDETVWRESEPGTPSPQARLAAVRRLNDAGIPTGVMLAPIMPGLNDDREQLAALVEAAAAAGATHITPIVLHLRPGVKEVFWPWLQERHPELVARYTALYRGSQALPRYRTPIEDFVKERRRAVWARTGGPVASARWRVGPEQDAEVPSGHTVTKRSRSEETDGQLSLL